MLRPKWTPDERDAVRALERFGLRAEQVSRRAAAGDPLSQDVLIAHEQFGIHGARYWGVVSEFRILFARWTLENGG